MPTLFGLHALLVSIMDGQILACIDGPAYANSICDHAAWFARRAAGPIQLLHVTDPNEHTLQRLALTSRVGPGCNSASGDNATPTSEKARIDQEQGRAILYSARRRLHDAGITHITELHENGDAAKTIMELEAGASLVVLGKRGERGRFSPADLGSKVEHVLRGSTRPVLLVPSVYAGITRSVVAFDASPSARKALEHVVHSAVLKDMACYIVIVANSSREAERRAGIAYEVSKTHPNAIMIALRGEIEPLITRQLRRGAGDLLVMGSYAHSRIRELLVGRSTANLIKSAKVPLLLFR